MKSMTGFGKSQCELANRKYTFEIKTLNSKSLDLIVKLPSTLRSRELDIRALVSRLERGKVDVFVTQENDATSANQLNQELLVSRYQEVSKLALGLECDSTNVFSTLLGMSDVWTTADVSELSDDEWAQVTKAINEAVDAVDEFRSHEGEVLKADFEKHISVIEQKLSQVPQYEQERISVAKDRIRRFVAESAVKEVDDNRFEQELIYYLEKLDITEEKIRLAKHIDYFRHTMNHEEGCGKKLAFVAQEMGREINTTGSKANHVEIQKLVVEMKDELEKIKEQLGNIL